MILTLLKTVAFNALPFMGKYWKLISIGIIVIGLILYRSYLIGEIEDRDAMIVTKTEENLSLTAAIMQQNSEIEKWVNIGKAEQTKYKNLKKTINTLKKVQEKELSALMKEKKPETCEGAIRYLIDGKDDLKWD